MSAPSRQMLARVLQRPVCSTSTWATAPSSSSSRSASSFSLASLRDLFPRRSSRRQSDEQSGEQPAGAGAASAADSSEPATAIKSEQPKSLFDATVEQDSQVLDALRARDGLRRKPTTFHKSSTANFKTSRRKLNDLGRLIAGRTADEAILQLKVSPKKQSSRLLSMLALARDHAVAKGLSRDKLVVAQSWTTKGPYLKRLDIKGRGRYGVKHHPSAKLHVLLAEGRTTEEKKRQRKQDQWRSSLRGLNEGDGVGVGKAKPLINVGVGGWRW